MNVNRVYDVYGLGTSPFNKDVSLKLQRIERSKLKPQGSTDTVNDDRQNKMSKVSK